MEGAFGKAKLSGYVIVGNKVRVPRLQRHTYLAALADGNALPQNFGTASEKMFASDSPFDTRDIRDRKARFANEQEVAHVVRKMKGIQEAKVIIQDLPAPAFGAAKDRRATVVVKGIGNGLLERSQLTSIRMTVA